MTWRCSSMMMMGVLLTAGACGNEPTGEDHATPAAAKLFGPIGQELTPAVSLARGQTIRIEVKFYADDGALITGLEDEHSAALTFAPGALATVASVTGQKFFFDVTAANVAGTGQLSVGWGHTPSTSELTFGPFTVTIP